MQSLEGGGGCPECSASLIDTGDELVCPGCGIVGDKQVVEFRRGRDPVAADFTPQALGSYFGSADRTRRERQSTGFARAHSTYGYLKTISDFAGRDDGTLFECARMVERVCGRLCLPNVVMVRAVAIARKLLGSRSGRRRATIATVSAFSIIASCRIGKVGSVSTREVIEAHRALGRSLRVSSIIQLSLDSEVRIEPRSPEDYVERVLAKLHPTLRNVSPLGARTESRLRELRGLATEILHGVPESSKAGHRPCALAATAVYAAEVVLAAREGRARQVTQRDVADCGDTAEYTVREQYREIVAPATHLLARGLTLPAAPAR